METIAKDIRDAAALAKDRTNPLDVRKDLRDVQTVAKDAREVPGLVKELACDAKAAGGKDGLIRRAWRSVKAGLRAIFEASPSY